MKIYKIFYFIMAIFISVMMVLFYYEEIELGIFVAIFWVIVPEIIGILLKNKTCPGCGRVTNHTGKEFCSHCGFKFGKEHIEADRIEPEKEIRKEVKITKDTVYHKKQNR